VQARKMAGKTADEALFLHHDFSRRRYAKLE
jgi:hypothetical protein